TSCFLRMEEDPIKNTSTLLDFVLLQIQQKRRAIEQLQLGQGFVEAVHPWALVFVSTTKHLEVVLRERMKERQYLDAIRICHTETIHQLKAMLCAFHIHPEGSGNSNNLLEWIELEKEGQPP
ncbi:hypothetical protein BDF14DRAFT_1709806, partial [Spinellus fusiger]